MSSHQMINQHIKLEAPEVQDQEIPLPSSTEPIPAAPNGDIRNPTVHAGLKRSGFTMIEYQDFLAQRNAFNSYIYAREALARAQAAVQAQTIPQTEDELINQYWQRQNLYSAEAALRLSTIHLKASSSSSVQYRNSTLYCALPYCVPATYNGEEISPEEEKEMEIRNAQYHLHNFLDIYTTPNNMIGRQQLAASLAEGLANPDMVQQAALALAARGDVHIELEDLSPESHNDAPSPSMPMDCLPSVCNGMKCHRRGKCDLTPIPIDWDDDEDSDASNEDSEVNESQALSAPAPSEQAQAQTDQFNMQLQAAMDLQMRNRARAMGVDESVIAEWKSFENSLIKKMEEKRKSMTTAPPEPSKKDSVGVANRKRKMGEPSVAKANDESPETKQFWDQMDYNFLNMIDIFPKKNIEATRRIIKRNKEFIVKKFYKQE